MDIKRITKEYYKQLYTNKFDNLDKIVQFLERYNLPRLTQEEIDNLDKPICFKEIESAINNLPKYKAPDLHSFKFYQTFREETPAVL